MAIHVGPCAGVWLNDIVDNSDAVRVLTYGCKCYPELPRYLIALLLCVSSCMLTVGLRE